MLKFNFKVEQQRLKGGSALFVQARRAETRIKEKKYGEGALSNVWKNASKE